MDRVPSFRRHWKRLAAGLVCLGGWVSPALADQPQALPMPSPTGHYFGSGCYKPCPKPMYVAPMPTVPGTTPPSTMPPSTTPPTTTPPGTTPDVTMPAEAAPTDLSASLGSQATEATGSYSPNMFGDFFGGRTLRLPGGGGAGSPIPIRDFFRDPGTGQLVIFNASQSGSQVIFTPGPGAPPTAFGQPFSENFVSAGAATVGQSPIPLQENSQVSQATLNGAMQRFGPGGTLLFVSGPNDSRADGAPAGSSQYNIFQSYIYTPAGSSTIIIPSPTGGGVVGQTKISEDNNPLPRDRVIMGFDYFDNVAIGVNGVDVRRYSPGIEKTFLDRRASIEVRMPFASTLSSNIVDGGLGNATNTEFGNINVTLKGLLVRGETINVASGVGIALPTSDDLRAFAGGTEVLRIENEAVLLSPYVAVLFTPNERLFAQSWAQIGFDVNGNPVRAGAGLGTIGRLNDQELLSLDGQVGYWLYRSCDCSSTLRGLAGFAELHYNTPLGDPDNLAVGGVTFATGSGNYDELNLTAGFITQIRDNINLSMGLVTPLQGDPNRFFDYQIGVRANIFFGPTAAARDPAAQASSF